MFLGNNIYCGCPILAFCLWLLALIYFFYDSGDIKIKEIPEDSYYWQQEKPRKNSSEGSDDNSKDNFWKKLVKYVAITFGVALIAVTGLIVYSYVSTQHEFTLYQTFRQDFQEYVEITRAASPGSYSYSRYFTICENANLWHQKVKDGEAVDIFQKLLVITEWAKDEEAQTCYALLKVEVAKLKDLPS